MTSEEKKLQSSFDAIGLKNIYCERLAKEKILSPTAIQKDLFEPITNGTCVLGLAKTGTGKTLSYLGPLVQKYSVSELDQEKSDNESQDEENDGESNKGQPKVFVLVPTRELASQVQSTFVLLSEAEQQAVVVVGGESEDKQIDAMGQAKFVIATPGRLLDLLKRKKISTREVDVVVMDEADRLLDMGFIDDIRSILRHIKTKPQLVCVSATLHLGVEEVAYEMGLNPIRFGVEEEEMTVKGLDHRVAHVGDKEKFHALTHFIHERKESRGIVFSNYRDRAHEVASRLRGLGYKADALSAQLSQSLRKRITDAYRTGDTMILVASDLAARGLDFLDIDYVINIDLPDDPATYVHRVGRTARAGREGRALSLLGFEDAFRIDKLESYLGEKIEVEAIPVEKLSGSLPRGADKAEPPRASEERYAGGRTSRDRNSGGRNTGGRNSGGRSFDKKSYDKKPKHSAGGKPQHGSSKNSEHAKPRHGGPKSSHPKNAHSKNAHSKASHSKSVHPKAHSYKNSKKTSKNGIFGKLWGALLGGLGIKSAVEVKAKPKKKPHYTKPVKGGERTYAGKKHYTKKPGGGGSGKRRSSHSKTPNKTPNRSPNSNSGRGSKPTN